MDDLELSFRASNALEAKRTAAEYSQAADETVDTPGNAAKVAWDAAALLRVVGEAFIDMADQQTFAARRYEKAQREEDRTGREYRAKLGVISGPQDAA